MTLRSEWVSIAARIDGFLTSTSTYHQGRFGRNDDPYEGANKVLLPESQRIFTELQAFVSRHAGSLPPGAREATDRFLMENGEFFQSTWRGGWLGLNRVAPALASVRAEVAFHLADFAATAKRLSERAFIHLQRTIVVDMGVRAQWKGAFADGEVSCERLGAVHLLSHGIWAFKVTAEGERTDLVFADRAIDQPEVEEVAEALVLTEWKKVTRPEERDAKAEEARTQTSRYSAGSLAGIELASYRFIVLVSERNLKPLPDIHSGEVAYRHINLAVDPTSPSRG